MIVAPAPRRALPRSISRLALLLGVACGQEPSPPASPASPASPVAGAASLAPGPCPTGMVLISPPAEPFTLGMQGQPYGIVETAHLTVVDAPEAGCGAAIAGTPGALTCWVQTNLTDPVVAPHPVRLAPYCIDAYPFPGEGADYTLDGMTAWDTQKLAELLASGRYGSRRLCTYSELEAAVAGPRGNRRFVYGDRPDPARCPDGARIGADPGCRNEETGVHEYGAVMSHWVVADPDFVQHACPSPPCTAAGNHPLLPGALLVAGGTARAQTRQAPLTPHTWHDHGEPNPVGCDQMGWDDQPVICADPDPRYATRPLPAPLDRGEAGWAALIEVARQERSVTAFLEAGLGVEVCDEPLPEAR